MVYQRAGEDASERTSRLRNAVDGPRQSIEESVVEPADRLFQPIVPEVIVAEHPHPLIVVRLKPRGGGVTGGNGLCRYACGEAAGLHRIDDAPTAERVDHMRR